MCVFRVRVNESDEPLDSISNVRLLPTEYYATSASPITLPNLSGGAAFSTVSANRLMLARSTSTDLLTMCVHVY